MTATIIVAVIPMTAYFTPLSPRSLLYVCHLFLDVLFRASFGRQSRPVRFCRVRTFFLPFCLFIL